MPCCRQMGRPDDGTDPTGFYNAEFQVPLKHRRRVAGKCIRKPAGGGSSGQQPRTKDELVAVMQRESGQRDSRASTGTSRSRFATT